MIVTTADCPERIVRQARDMAVPLVSSEWIIQSILHGRRFETTASPQFHYTHRPDDAK